MPTNCCVPGCKSNNNKKEKNVSIFKFPKTNPDKLAKWKKSIPRDFEITNHSVVCIKHFAECHIIREDRRIRPDGSELVVKRGKLGLTDDAVPSIFPNLPSYLEKKLPIKRQEPTKRKERVGERPAV